MAMHPQAAEAQLVGKLRREANVARGDADRERGKRQRLEARVKELERLAEARLRTIQRLDARVGDGRRG